MYEYSITAIKQNCSVLIQSTTPKRGEDCGVLLTGAAPVAAHDMSDRRPGPRRWVVQCCFAFARSLSGPVSIPSASSIPAVWSPFVAVAVAASSWPAAWTQKAEGRSGAGNRNRRWVAGGCRMVVDLILPDSGRPGGSDGERCRVVLECAKTLSKRGKSVVNKGLFFSWTVMLEIGYTGTRGKVSSEL